MTEPMKLGGLLVLALCSTAFADEPSAYQCAPGKAAVGQGCTCPAGYTNARNGDNTAVCRTNAPVGPALVRLTIEITGRFQPPAAAATPPVFKPQLDLDSMLAIEGLVGNIRSEQERLLQDLIDNTPDSEPEEKGDYYFRLGELHAKQHRFWRLKALEGRDATASTKAGEYLKKAVATYNGLVSNRAFRNYPKMDMALFYYAYTLQSAKLMKEARAVYDRLLKEYPNSKYVPESHLAFAEVYFETGQLVDAEQRYKRILQFPKSSAYWFAVYKLGWVHLQLKRYKEAAEHFAQVVTGTKDLRVYAPLHQESTKDLVRAVAELGKPDVALALFKKVDDKTAVDQMTSLAKLHTAEGHHEHARAVYRELMTKLPSHGELCAWQTGYARATLSIIDGNKTKAVDVCKTEVDTFKSWASTNGLVVR